jgi:hypothetical protein
MYCKLRYVLAPLLLIPCACSGQLVLDPGDDHDGGSTDAPEAQAPSDEYIFDTARFHHFALEVAPEDWQYLKEYPLLEQYVPATMIFEGQRYEGAAVRFKGDYNTLGRCFEGGEPICPKLSIKVSFNEYGPGRFAGLRKLIFNSSVLDPSLMREVLAYRLFRQMGIWAPRASHAQVTVNGEWQGVFVLVEYIDKEFIQERWDLDEGNLYKTVWPWYDSSDPYIRTLRTNKDIPDVSDMLAFKSLLDATSDASFATDIANTLDTHYMARYLVVDQVIVNNDGPRMIYCYGGEHSQNCGNHNYYWYHEPGAIFHLIPWDLDYSWQMVNSDLGRSLWNPNCARIPYCRFHNIPNCLPQHMHTYVMPTQCDPLLGHVHRATWNEYLAAMAELAAGPLSEAEVSPFLQAQRDKIGHAVSRDPFGPGVTEWRSSNDWLDSLLALQRVEIDALLAEQLP